MSGRDFFLDQIDKAAITLASLLNNLEDEGDASFEVTTETLKSKLNIDLPKLIFMSSDGMIKYLTTELKFSNDALFSFCEVLNRIKHQENAEVKTLIDMHLRNLYRYMEQEKGITFYGRS